jgi:hypothetical protein
MRPNGYTIYSDRSRVIIATGLGSKRSVNRKTGDMVQIWILTRGVDPVRAVSTGKDSLICGDCPHRGVKGSGRSCYVNVGQAPLGIWRAWKRGSYPKLKDYSVFAGRAVRFGAYGDPIHIPIQILKSIASVAKRWTGYTHQWRVSPSYRPFLMASCDSVADQTLAIAQGWRTFRVRTAVEPLMGSEIMCPASPEAGNRSQCASCGLCRGTSLAAKNIAIIVHGSSASNFVSLTSLTRS